MTTSLDATSPRSLDTSRDSNLPTSPGILFQCITTLLDNFFPISNLKFLTLSPTADVWWSVSQIVWLLTNTVIVGISTEVERLERGKWDCSGALCSHGQWDTGGEAWMGWIPVAARGLDFTSCKSWTIAQRAFHFTASEICEKKTDGKLAATVNLPYVALIILLTLYK